MKRKGFTLVELLAIISLLAVLVIIIFPKIIDVIEKKNNEIDEATLSILYSAAEQYLDNNPDLYPSEIGYEYCFELTDLSNENLIPIDIKKYEKKGIKVKVGEQNSYKLTDCSINMLLTEYIKELSLVNLNLIKDNTTDKNIRYVGKLANNYIKIGDSLYRIIGLMNNVILSDSYTTNTLVKVVSVSSQPEMTFGGNNVWASSNIKNYIDNTYSGLVGTNSKYIESVRWILTPVTYDSSVNFFKAYDQERFIPTSSISIPQNTKYTLSQYISVTVSAASSSGQYCYWGDVYHYGDPHCRSVGAGASSTAYLYNSTTGATKAVVTTGTSSATYKFTIADRKSYDQFYVQYSSWVNSCGSEGYDGWCSYAPSANAGASALKDNSQSIISNYGLMYISDIGLSSSNEKCLNSSIALNGTNNEWFNNDCSNTNWLYNKSSEWLLSPYVGNSLYQYNVSNNGYISNKFEVSNSLNFRTTFYLKDNVMLLSGLGTKNNPYIIE